MDCTLFRCWRGVVLVAMAWALAGHPPVSADDRAAEAKPAAQPGAGTSIDLVGEKGKTEPVIVVEKGDWPTLAPPKKGNPRDPGKADSGTSGTGPAGRSPPGTEMMPFVVPDRPSADSGDATPRPAAKDQRGASQAAAEGRSTASPGGNPSDPSGDAALRPIPDAPATGPVEIETASFNGVTPGMSTLDDVRKSWGPPKQTKSQGGTLANLYKVDPFDHVEVFSTQGKVTSIVIRLNRVFPADGVARQLALSHIRPVLVSNALGEVLGQSYPERGVLFSFEPSTAPGKTSLRVAQIILEPVTAEPFVLRAETNLESQPEASLRDVDQALKLAPQNARAHWLRARLLVLSGDHAKAVAAAGEAVRLDPKDAQFRVTKAQILGQMGRFAEAVQEAEQAVALSGQRPHVKARAQCLVGDLLGSGPQPDYKRAAEYHTQAIKTADPLRTSPHPAVRQPAKEVLIDAHLGAAHDIAWGNWNQKETAVRTWLQRASTLAEELIQRDGGSAEHRFRVATRALAAYVGAQGKLDPGEWADKVLQVGQEMIATAGDASQKQQVQWEVGLALYDAVQVYQMRGDRELALKSGQRAIEYLESGRASKESPADTYLLGRLYFRLGSIHAIGNQNHAAAIEWFEKAVPWLQQAVPQVATFELGRLGETFVSIGVSYWETGQRETAVKLSQQGVELMEKAAAAGALQKDTLDVPYTNLATMHRQLGQDQDAEKYLEKVGRKGSTIRR